MTSTTITALPKTGSLIIAGSGIASVAHMTIETLAYLQESDAVFYVVSDPATEAFIHKNAKGPCKDLHVFYGKDKSRYDTYVQMAETMLDAVRAGQEVLGIFYGHPGVFVSPSRRALAIAREEGFEAKMLPFDPATHGCCAYEATHLLLKNIPLDTTINNIIWQVGGVGVSKMDFENSKFKLLVDRLEKDFGPDHRVVHYIGAVLPQHTTVKDMYRVSDLRKPEVAAQFNACSTLYVPPLKGDDPFPAHVVEALFGAGMSIPTLSLYPVAKWDLDNSLASVPAYGPRELAAVAALEHHAVPADYRELSGSPAMHQIMTELALRPALQAKYKADPRAVVDTVPGLTTVERAALVLGAPGPVYGVMKRRGGETLDEETTLSCCIAAVPEQSCCIAAVPEQSCCIVVAPEQSSISCCIAVVPEQSAAVTVAA